MKITIDPEHLGHFKAVLYHIYDLPEKTWVTFNDQLYGQVFEKGEEIHSIGEVVDKIYFICSGAVRVYIEKNKKELSSNFRFKHQFVTSITSFIVKEPSKYALKAMAKTHVITMDRNHLYHMYDNYLEFNVLGRVVMESLMMEKGEREYELLSLNAEERYLKLMEEYPDYIKNIPLKYLASYIGVAAESLSRIRANLNN